MARQIKPTYPGHSDEAYQDQILPAVSRTFASAALTALASIPRLRKRGMFLVLGLVERRVAGRR